MFSINDIASIRRKRAQKSWSVDWVGQLIARYRSFRPRWIDAARANAAEVTDVRSTRCECGVYRMGKFSRGSLTWGNSGKSDGLLLTVLGKRNIEAWSHGRTIGRYKNRRGTTATHVDADDTRSLLLSLVSHLVCSGDDSWLPCTEFGQKRATLHWTASGFLGVELFFCESFLVLAAVTPSPGSIRRRCKRAICWGSFFVLNLRCHVGPNGNFRKSHAKTKKRSNKMEMPKPPSKKH